MVPADAAGLIASGKLDGRLFDVTALDTSRIRKAQQNGLKVIVGYQGTANSAKAEVRGAGTLRRTLRSLNADAVQTPQRDVQELWKAVTDGDTAASGIAHIWLDGVRKASLDRSVPQIGAPQAWSAGYDGTGTAYPDANALIVACEFCSLCYQPTDLGVGSLLSNGLFGDGVAAAVVRGRGGTGVKLERNGSYLIPKTEEWIAYDVRATGFHFLLDKRVPATMEPLAPALQELARQHRWDASELDFYIIHAGGPRILDDLSKFLRVPPEAFRFSRATLTEYGNIASAVVLDALRRLFEAGGAEHEARGMLAGFGPGITAEMSLGRWQISGNGSKR
ncbi:3-oxoacyl-[acyl-carrier-protein] synthase III C-terminal domain-containing protein [Streptomyces sp. NPDC004290]